MREVPGGDGNMGQNSLHVHVGLGNATNVDLVRIEWPSGTMQELPSVAANQFLTVTEPHRLRIEFGPFNEIIVRWPAEAVGFVLQSSFRLNPPVWTDVTDGIISRNGADMRYDGPEANENARFFRLNKN